MPHSQETLVLSSSRTEKEHQILALADTCFEMFPLRELRRPHLIVDELEAAFPTLERVDILRAIAMALSWRRLLHAAGRPLH